jgi:hypothetical protein
MKIIITENQYRLLRREHEIKNKVYGTLNNLTRQNNLRDLKNVGLDTILILVSDGVAVDIASNANLKGDEYVTFRNQIKQYIQNNFYEYIKDFLESKQ